MNAQVTGQLVGMEQRQQGWVAVHILEQGKQYPKKLSTKDPSLIQLAQQLMMQVVTAGFNEVQSDTINPRNNQPYTNRYLEALQMGAVQMPLDQPPMQQQPVQQYVPPQQASPVLQQYAQQAAPPVQGQIQHTTIPGPQGQITHIVRDDEVREMRIMRQAAGKVSVALLPLLQPEDQNLASLVRISEQLVKYFRDGVNWQTAPIQQPQAQPQAQPQQAPQPGEDASQYGYEPPVADDDIPY